MGEFTPRQQRHAHLIEKLTRELGPAVTAALADDDVIEIMVNPNGELFLDRLSRGVVRTGVVVPDSQVELTIGTVASLHDLVVTPSSPLLKVELPLGGERFQGMLRPVSPPAYVIRKPLKRVIPLDEQVAAGTCTPWQAAALREALRRRRNIVLAGATLSGKTVLCNSLLHEAVRLFGPQLRLVLLEDTYELRVESANVVHLHTTDTVDLQALVRATLRLRPDRIIVGEVRGAEALDLLKAWATGHPGGVTTVHADNAEQALFRLEALVEEAGVHPNRTLIGSVVHLIVMMERVGPRQWRIREMAEVTGWQHGRYQLTQIQHQEVSYEETGMDNGTCAPPLGSGRAGDGLGRRGQWSAVGHTTADGE